MKTLASLAWFAGACALAFCQEIGNLPATPERNLPNCRPEDVGLSAERLERIGAMILRHVDERRLPGAVVLVARDGRVACFDAFGVTNVETKTPMRRDTIFRIMSMTKPIVSVAAMMLYEEGLFQLDDPVSKFIPEFKRPKVYVEGGTAAWTAAKREVTIQDLLRHTSGLVYESRAPSELFKAYQEAKASSQQALGQAVAKIGKLPLLHSPGEKWTYGRSTEVLGGLVETISGQPLDVFLQERIFGPLQMMNTGFRPAETGQDRVATVHHRTESATLTVRSGPESDLWSPDPKFFEPGAGLFSTAADYFRFAQMLLNRGELDGVRILAPRTVDFMVMNHVPSVAMPPKIDSPTSAFLIKGHGFGLGFRTLVDPVEAATAATVGSYGWFGFYDTYFVIDPKERLVGIFLSAFRPPPAYPGVREFETLLFQSVVR